MCLNTMTPVVMVRNLPHQVKRSEEGKTNLKRQPPVKEKEKKKEKKLLCTKCGHSYVSKHSLANHNFNKHMKN